MSERAAATNAASSGIMLDRKTIKALCRRSDRPGLLFLAKWTVSLLLAGYAVYLSMETAWLWPALFVYGSVIGLPSYAMSHESAHGTAFRTRWLNEALFWVTSLVYMEEPLYRRYTHTGHHTYTLNDQKDTQLPVLPVTLRSWSLEVSGLALTWQHLVILLRLMAGRFTEAMRRAIPQSEFARIRRNAWIIAGIYTAIGVAIALGVDALLWYLVIPVFIGQMTMSAFSLVQHVEMAKNEPSILDSTRSFRTNPLVSFLYLNMEHHVEHHLYPQVPFYSLPALNRELQSQLPEPDPGFLRTFAESLYVAVKRSLGRNTRAPSIRQAPAMITNAGFDSNVSRSTP